MSTTTPTAVAAPPVRVRTTAARDVGALISSRAFVAIVFLATIVQVLGNPLTAMATGAMAWNAPLPFAAVVSLAAAGCALQAASLLMFDRRPTTAMLGTLACYLVVTVVGSVPAWTGAMKLVIALALFALATRKRPPVATGWLAATVVVSVGSLALWAWTVDASASMIAGFLIDEALSLAVPAAAGVTLGVLWAMHTQRATIAEEQADCLAREHETSIGHARDKERARIAQELHDVAGQHIAGLVSLCDASAALAPAQPEQALHLIDEVRTEARFAAASLYGALGDLRAVDTESTSVTPDLRSADELVHFWSRRGMTVSSYVSGDTSDLPAVVSTIAYRGLQEALANAAKHAPGSKVDVRVVAESDRVRIIVSNTAPVTARPSEEPIGLGWGLNGLRDRLRLVDGVLRAASDESGGWRTQLDIAFPALAGVPSE